MSKAVPWAGVVITTGKSTTERNSPIKAEQLQGNLSLIVIHRHHTVKVTASRGDEQGVGREGSFNFRSVCPGLFNRRPDHRDLFSPKQPSFARVRIQRGNRDAWNRNPAGPQRLVKQINGAADPINGQGT